MHHSVAAVLRLYAQGGPRGKVVEEGSAFDLRSDDVAIHGVIEIGMTAKQLRTGVHPSPLRSGSHYQRLEYKPAVHSADGPRYQPTLDQSRRFKTLACQKRAKYHARPVPKVTAGIPFAD
jgi:hypothetical protein